MSFSSWLISHAIFSSERGADRHKNAASAEFHNPLWFCRGQSRHPAHGAALRLLNNPRSVAPLNPISRLSRFGCRSPKARASEYPQAGHNFGVAQFWIWLAVTFVIRTDFRFRVPLGKSRQNGFLTGAPILSPAFLSRPPAEG